MTSPIIDAEVREAIARRAGLAVSDLTFERIPVMRCEVVRLIESRTEESRRVSGSPDLGHLPAYQSLAGYPPGPPTDLYRSTRLELLRDGSVRVTACTCENGTVTCDSCGGGGTLSCDTTQSCWACGGFPSCRECGGSGHRYTDEPWNGTRQRISRTCQRCGGTGKCRHCRGRGRETCTHCDGSGWRRCGRCDGDGRLRHIACDGTGRFTNYTIGVIERRPDVQQIAQPDDLPMRVRWTLRKAPWRTTTVEGTVSAPGDLEPAHRAALAPALGKRPGQIAGRMTIRITEIVGASSPLLPDGRIFAVPAEDGGVALVRVRPRLATVLTVTVLVVVVAAIAVLIWSPWA